LKNFAKMSDKEIKCYLALEGIDTKSEDVNALLVSKITKRLKQEAERRKQEDEKNFTRHIAFIANLIEDNAKEDNGVYTSILYWKVPPWKVPPRIIEYFKGQGIDIVLAISPVKLCLARIVYFGILIAVQYGIFKVVCELHANYGGPYPWLGTITAACVLFCFVNIIPIAVMREIEHSLSSKYKAVLKNSCVPLP